MGTAWLIFLEVLGLLSFKLELRINLLSTGSRSLATLDLPELAAADDLGDGMGMFLLLAELPSLLVSKEEDSNDVSS